jgi:predicted DNA-binding protein
MAIVSLRVPNELKEKMDEHSEINWSAVIRANLEEELEQLESRRIGHAVAVSERLSNEINEENVKDENTAETVREWRENRYGANSTDV